MIRFYKHFHESPNALRNLRLLNSWEHKVNVWNSFIDSGLVGINDDDCSIFPRVLPKSYLPEINKRVREITYFILKLISLPEKEVKAIVPQGPIRDFLIHELNVLKYRPRRLTGSFRFDMAIVGNPEKGNPPKLLEINEIGFDGLARSSYIQDTLLKIAPWLKEHLIAYDTANAEAKNMRRLGQTLARFQEDYYNWEEETLIHKAQKLGVEIQMISPQIFQCKMDPELPLLKQKHVNVKNGYVRVGNTFQPDIIQLSHSFELKDYKKGKELYQKLVRSKTPQYGPFISGLVASKMILVLLSDPLLRRKFLGSENKLNQVVLPAFILKQNREMLQKEFKKWVLKYTDGLGGDQVYLGQEIPKRLKKIKPHEDPHWVIQKRTKLNTIHVHGILSRPRNVIADLGVFVQYDWANEKFLNFEVGGFITRATNKSLKVNVSGGGIQVPVMFLKNF